ncbi:L,D-transpeptidase family protein [Priestia koreensis]|uniref:L,D-transpeptidase family protein n=1 Tax=Priestia koreensis TaxID=284581 RepID=UPI001F59ED32|nr:L,D-transpeptidase family protein [Priestia koreensis]
MFKKWFICFIVTFVFLCGFSSVSNAASGNQLIIINKAKNQLAFYENNKLVKMFSVATGRKASYTPEGRFKVVNKIVNRPYYKGNIRGGDSRNPLGNRWLGINARGTWGTTYAIHGNNNTSSIGKYVSSGCIRMYNQEVQWLYSKVKVNTPVIITTSNKSFGGIAASNGIKVAGEETAPVAVITIGSTLKKGSRGTEVKKLQQLLTSQGYSTNGIDGIFGSGTDRAVRLFQKTHHLSVDGIVGANTYKALQQR